MEWALLCLWRIGLSLCVFYKQKYVVYKSLEEFELLIWALDKELISNLKSRHILVIKWTNSKVFEI